MVCVGRLLSTDRLHRNLRIREALRSDGIQSVSPDILSLIHISRPVKRAIQRYLLNDLSKKLLSQEVDRRKPIIVETAGDGLKFRN